jgi:hypothetical protein
MANGMPSAICMAGRRRLGNGEGEFLLVGASSSSVETRCGGVASLIDLLRNMSVVKLRREELTGIAEVTGTIGCAHRQIFCGCRRRACRSSVDRRLVFAGASRKLSRSVGDHRKGGHPDQIRSQMAGEGRPGHQQTDHDASRCHGPSGGAVVGPATESPGQSKLEAIAQLKPDMQPVAIDRPTMQIKRGVARTARSRRIARGSITHRLPRAGTGRGCCQFDHGQASSNAMPSRRAASSWPFE